VKRVPTIFTVCPPLPPAFPRSVRSRSWKKRKLTQKRGGARLASLCFWTPEEMNASSCVTLPAGA
jgi:hypothetical protein